MKLPWVICLAREDAASLASLRLLAGVEVATTPEVVWLRGQPGDESLEAKLAALPARTRYELLAANQLRQLRQRIPSARLPDLTWQPLIRWLQVELPAAALPGNVPESVSLRLVRSTCEEKPELLLTTIESFKDFVMGASRLRLDRLQFAADDARRVLVRGNPLPPIPGQRFVLHVGVAVPAGFQWEPQVSAEVLARGFGIVADNIVLWNEDGTITRLQGEQFIPVTRSAVLATQQAPDETV